LLYAVTILTFSNCSGVKVFCARTRRGTEKAAWSPVDLPLLYNIFRNRPAVASASPHHLHRYRNPLCGHDIDLFELLWRKGFLRAHASWYGEGPSRQSLRSGRSSLVVQHLSQPTSSCISIPPPSTSLSQPLAAVLTFSNCSGVKVFCARTRRGTEKAPHVSLFESPELNIVTA
jgi:hypothetical protein